jgi:hypothetical protein
MPASSIPQNTDFTRGILGRSVCSDRTARQADNIEKGATRHGTIDR